MEKEPLRDDTVIVLDELRAAPPGRGLRMSELETLFGGDSARLDRAVAALDERGLVRVFDGEHTREGRAILTPRAAARRQQ